jgi:DNA-binding PadR family transcriptional regulator
MLPSRSWIKDQILILLNQYPRHGYDLLRVLNESVPDLRLTTLYRWLHDMETKNLVHSVILPGPYGPNRRVYRIDSAGEKRLHELLENSIQVVLQFYEAFKNSLSQNVENQIAGKDDMAPKGRILFTAIPHVKKEDIDTLFFLSMRYNNVPIEILGNSKNIERFGINHRKVKGNVFELTNRKGPFSEIWLKWMSELDNLPSAIKGCKKALSSKGVLYIILPSEPRKDSPELSIREYIQGTMELDSIEQKIHQSKVGSMIKNQFSLCGSIDLFPGLDVYYCINET